MIKKRIVLFCFAIFLVGLVLGLEISSVSAAELPTVNGDNDNWGTMLNSYLNVSLNETGHLRANNLSLGDRITFSLGAILDNLVTGWIRITGGLNVTGDIVVKGIPLNNLTFNPILGYTTSSYDGNISNGSLNGYSAANAICASEYSGSHFCLKSEILKSISNGAYSFSGEVWFANGPPGYTAAANDCEGWTKVTGEIGPFWDWDENSGAGAGKLTPCSSELQLACCGGGSL